MYFMLRHWVIIGIQNILLLVRQRGITETVVVDQVVRLPELLLLLIIAVRDVVNHEEALDCESTLDLKVMASIRTNTGCHVAFLIHLMPLGKVQLAAPPRYSQPPASRAVDIRQGLHVPDNRAELNAVEV